MTPNPHIPNGSSVSTLVQNSTAWIGIGAAIFGVLNFAFLLGMWFGPMKNIPSQLETVIKELAEHKSQSAKHDWDIKDLEKRANATSIQITEAATDRIKIKDDLRKVESVANDALSRETFIEWKAALENRNKDISAPPLIQHR